MSGGGQQMAAVGRAMMSAPSILMLDEPSPGLSPLRCGELFRSPAQVKDTGAGRAKEKAGQVKRSLFH